MQFFQSMLCVKGSDNRYRFLAINIALYLSFIMLSALSSDNIVFSLMVLITTAAFSALSIIRRLNDAQLNKNWMYIATGLFVLCGMIIIFVGHVASYWLLMLPLGVLALLLTYPSAQRKNYILGYLGPVDLSQYQTAINDHSRRIEPSLVGEPQEVNIHYSHQSDIHQSSTSKQSASTSETQSDIGEQIRELLFNNKNAVITIASVLSVALVGMLISSLLSSPIDSEDITSEELPPAAVETVSKVRLHAVEFPDNFSLMINEYSGLFIHWQADETDQDSLWSQAVAQGDDTCAEIVFNNKKSVRTLSVKVENHEDYFAQFSPLDTKELLNHLAFRGSFSLCGYKFSLKGSQAILGKNPPYNGLVEY
ncbi:hypothetical protein [Thalassotalea atypica]|uniref:hypothetical protein n=1 Tax=Thalassotalea atypica TaxID=2054316 RepID=UPI0025724EEC|nr:hypothetical protein [Thalassotalea atypica]